MAALLRSRSIVTAVSKCIASTGLRGLCGATHDVVAWTQQHNNNVVTRQQTLPHSAPRCFHTCNVIGVRQSLGWKLHPTHLFGRQFHATTLAPHDDDNNDDAVAEDVDGGDGDGNDDDDHDPRSTLVEQTKPDEELAVNMLYFELLVRYWKETGEVPWYRIDELKSTEKFVMTVQRFAAMRAVVPELFAGLEERGVWSADAVSALDASHLATLAWAYARAGQGSDAFWGTITAASEATANIDECDKANLEWALSNRVAA